MTAPQFRDPQAERVYRRLLQIGAGAAAFFADAYRLVEEDHRLETRSHLIGHVLRELESSVRHVLAGATGAPIGKKENEENVKARETITHVVDELGLAGDDAVTVGWIQLSQTLHRFAHRSNLDPPRAARELEETWLTMLTVLDVLLDRFEARYADVYQRLDKLIMLEEPTRATAREIIQTIPQTDATQSYFFSRLTDPRWFPRLRKWSAVCAAPAPVIDEDANTIQFPAWHAAQYLKRVVTEFPREIARILEELETDNVRAQAQAMEIALLLPVDLTLSVVSRMRDWVPSILRYQFPCEALFNLIVRLADEGHPSSALSLADQILARPQGEDTDEVSTWARHEDVPYDLEVKAEQVFDALIKADTGATIDLIADQLEQRVLGDPVTGVGADGNEPAIPDYSTTWLPNLRSMAPRYRGSMRSFLAAHLRRALDTAIEHGADTSTLVEGLRARQTMLFRRIELDFLAGHAADSGAFVVERLMDRGVFKADDLRTEYAELVQVGFPLLSATKREVLIGWIDEGLDHWGEVDDDENRSWLMMWKRDWLALMEPHLDAPRQETLRELIDTYGPPEPFRRVETMARFVGLESPVDTDELGTLSTDEMVALLRGWEPDGTPDSASRAGLGRALSAAVADDPQRFANAAGSFRDLHPAYFDAVLTGLSKAFRDGDQFEWAPVLDLTERLAEEAIATDASEQIKHGELSVWVAVKRSILDLLELGLCSGDRAIPVDRGEQVWRLIASLAGDEDPSPAREREWVDRDLDATSLALNSVRPRAIAAAIQFVFWTNSLAEADEPIGFEALPEVATLLQQHMDPSLDPSVAVRAVFGQELGRLIWFDHEWVGTRRASLFPKNPGAQGLRRAVFDAFLRYSRLHSRVLPVLAEEYEAAVYRSKIRREQTEPRDPDKKLAEHLMTLYGWGELDLETGLIPLFFSEAPGDLCKEALHFVGWSLNRLKYTDDTVDEGVVERLKALWDWRASSLEASLAGDDSSWARSELMEFGWWFASRVFDVSWSLSRLRRVLELCGTTAWDRQVAEYLADLVDAYAGEVIETLTRVDPRGGREPGYSLHWRDHARTIFAATVTHEDPEIRQRATELVNRWIAQGHPNLQDLLPPGT